MLTYLKEFEKRGINKIHFHVEVLPSIALSVEPQTIPSSTIESQTVYSQVIEPQTMSSFVVELQIVPNFYLPNIGEPSQSQTAHTFNSCDLTIDDSLMTR